MNYRSEAPPASGFHSRRVATAALVGSGLVIPLILLEWVNQENFLRNFPLVLFATLWALPFLSVLLWPVAFRHGVRSWGGTAFKWVAAVLLLFFAWLWFGIVIDQMPCFLGVPNCD
jgi:hypothetical protein